MTDKQIIIDDVDGLSCTNCSEAKRCQEQQAKKEYAINQVLQDIPSEYANVIARLKQIIPYITRCDYVLEKQLKHKKQECEKLKEDLIEAKAHGDYLNNLALSETLNLVSEQLDQLKAENEILEKDKANLAVITETLKVQFKQLKQTLAEIKEIAENNKKSTLCFTAFEGDVIEVNNKPMTAILQKINECEVDK